MTTVQTLVPERLWQAIEPLLPAPPPRYGGRPRVDRACLAGIADQLRTGVPWRRLLALLPSYEPVPDTSSNLDAGQTWRPP
jgi:transposase